MLNASPNRRTTCSITVIPILTIALSMLLYSLQLSSSSAQTTPLPPTSLPPQDVESLQRQLLSLQSQLLAAQQNDQASKSNSRVRSVGTQRTTRPIPELVVDDALYIRLYDLSDIFAVSRHYPAVIPDEIGTINTQLFESVPGNMSGGGFGGGGGGGGGFGGGRGGGGGVGGGVFRVPPSRVNPPRPQAGGSGSVNLSSADVSLTKLVAAIKSTVSPKKWGSGNNESKVQALGNTLLITATNDMHEQISGLLDLFREHWGKLRTISVQTYWIRASATEANELLNQDHQESIGAGVVDAGRWKKFLADAKTNNQIAFSATLTSHDNQTVHAISGRQEQLTLGAEPFRASSRSSQPDGVQTESNSIIGFTPIRLPFHHGAAFQVTPLATRGGNFVVLDMHAKLNQLANNPDAEQRSVFAFLENGEKIQVDLDPANYIAYRYSSSVRCPKEQFVLAGGMTYDSTTDSEQPNLYLFVKATVHTINEDESDWKKSKSKKQTEAQNVKQSN